jgi:hypothetical protein
MNKDESSVMEMVPARSKRGDSLSEEKVCGREAAGADEETREELDD